MFYLKPLVLQNLLDGHQLSGVAEFSLVDDAKRAVTDDLSVRVAHLLWPVRALAWSGHNCCYLAAILVPLKKKKKERKMQDGQNKAVIFTSRGLQVWEERTSIRYCEA